MPESPSPLRRILGLDLPLTPDVEFRELTAASVRVGRRKIARAATNEEAWQQEAVELYSEVGELRYVANAQANAVSRARLFVGKWEDATTEPVEVIGGTVRDVWDSFGGGTLGRSELVKRLAVQLFVPGDGYIVGLPPGMLEDNGDELPPASLLTLDDLSWHVFAATEVKLARGKLTVNLGDRPRSCPTDLAVVVRAWRPNPFRWWQADSPVRSNLAVLREIVGLTKHVSATIDSRLAGAGMLIMGNSFSLLQGQSPDADDSSQVDPVLAALEDAMLTAIKDRDAASAVMPILLTGPDEAVDKVHHMTFATPFDAATKDLRDEAIRRLALGLDAPPEVLLGLGSSSHWNAWIIQDESIRTHVEPTLALIAEALTADFLWPMLEELGVPDARSYAVWFDTSNLTQRADRSSEAIRLFELGQLSGEALRREAGFDEDDAPAEVEDQAAQTALDLIAQAPSLLSDPGLPGIIAQIREALGGGPVDVVVDAPVPDDDGLPTEDMPPLPEADDLVAAAELVAPGGGLPDAYRPADSEDVPAGEACANCAFLDRSTTTPEGAQWCEWWEDWVEGDHYCDAWRAEGSAVVVAAFEDARPGQGELPESYREATAAESAIGLTCGGCARYDAATGECGLWSAPVDASFRCDEWRSSDVDGGE